MRSRHYPLFLGAFMAAAGPFAWSASRDGTMANAVQWCSSHPLPDEIVLDKAQADGTRHFLALFGLHRSQTRTLDLHLLAYAGSPRCMLQQMPASQRRAL